MQIDRRRLITGAAAGVSLSLIAVPMARALPDDVAASVEAILNGRSPRDGGIDFDMPAVAENGAQVPVTITVDSPMTPDDHVTTIHIIATDNPVPEIGRFHLTPQLARAEVFTRLRAADSQEILVFAELSNGDVLQAAAEVVVTIGGCTT
jgi:sulfur-oxidizing protein SoxY